MSNDSYKEYRKYFTHIPRLSREEEVDLFTRLPNEPQLVEVIVKHNLRFVAFLAFKLRSNNIDIMDLIQEGNIGLLNAIQLYRLDADVPFPGFAYIHIRAKMLNYIERNTGCIPIYSTKVQRKVYHNIRPFIDIDNRISVENKRKLKELCGATDSDIDKVHNLMYGDVSLDAVYSEDFSIMDTLIDERQNIENTIALNESYSITYNRLSNAIDTLPSRDKYIFNRRNVNGDTLDTLSKELNISKERVRQIESRAFDKLRNNVELRDAYISLME